MIPLLSACSLATAAETAVGTVFRDDNRSGTLDPGEQGIPHVRVSNGREVVVTDSEGRYRLPVGNDTIVFVIKPSGWMTPVTGHQLPRFHYIHKPAGSPELKHRGVAPTGPLPASIDFPLTPHREPKQFRAVILGDTQPASQKEVDYLAHDVVHELIGVDAMLGITLGDIVGDKLPLYETLVPVVGRIGVPWHNVIGNHDENYDSPDDLHADETYERVFGPATYSFNYADVHFVALDDVIWTGPTEDSRGRYHAGLTEQQLEFVRNDLALVPKDRLVVVMMHIPIYQIENRGELYNLLAQHPHTLSLSAHTHIQRHHFINRDSGWAGPTPHHHLNCGTACGSWWRGAPDEVGLPHATMTDGTPNGYSIITFDGPRYSVEYKAARRPADYQMNIYAPDEVGADAAGETEVLVNVFAGSPRSTVKLRLGDEGPWTPMEMVARIDPGVEAIKQAEKSSRPPAGRQMPRAENCPHLWRATLPANPPAGTHLIRVTTTDMFGHTYTDKRMIRVR